MKYWAGEYGIIVLGPYATRVQVNDALTKVNLLVNEVLPETRIQWKPSDAATLKQKVETMMQAEIKDWN